MTKLRGILKSDFFIVIQVCLLKLMLDYIYIYVVSPSYSYMGLTVSISTIRETLSWIMVAISAVLLLKLKRVNDMNHKGSIIISVLICCSAIPTATIVASFDVNFFFPLLILVYWFLITAFYITNFSRKTIILPINLDMRLILWIVVAIFVLADFFICLKYTGFNINFNLSEVYLERSSFKTDNIPVILQYLFFASTTVFPVICVYELKKKNYLLFVFFIICQLLAFSADGRKATLFVLIATIGGYLFIKYIDIRVIPFILNIIVLSGIIEKIVFKSTVLINYLIRRLFLLPAYLQYAYYDFFSVNEKDLFRQSVIGKLGIQSSYSSLIPKIIGSKYYGGSYANNGLFADAYSNLGIVGVIILPILICIALKLLDRCGRNLEMGICIGLIFTSSYTLLSSSFFTVMLTHGFIISCLVIACIPREEKIQF